MHSFVRPQEFHADLMISSSDRQLYDLSKISFPSAFYRVLDFVMHLFYGCWDVKNQ